MDQEDRSIRQRQVFLEFLAERGAGNAASIADVVARYPELAPELREMLEGGLKKLRLAIAAQSTTKSAVKGYSFRRELSSGGQGVVYEAIQESTGQTVAIKIFRPLNRHGVGRFEREVASLAGLHHPGIVRIVDCGRTIDGSSFLAMEFIEGCDLDEWVSRHCRNIGAQAELVRCFAAIARAVGAAHRSGIVHRDLKPSNIRVDSTGQPRIIDFGLATLLNDLTARELTQTGHVLGSLAWLSPEQASGSSRDVGPASDIYSLGVIFYHSLSGRFPYSVDGPMHLTVKAICSTKATRLHALSPCPNGPVSEALSAAIERCLAKEPSARFASGEDLADALIASIDHPARPRNYRLAKRLVAASVAVLALTATLAGSWAIVQQPADSAPRDSVELPLYVNSIGMRLRKIPAGPYRIGRMLGDTGREDDQPERIANIESALWIAETEVTVEQFRKVMNASPPPSRDQQNLPVDKVSWTTSSEFCRRLSQKDGRRYRLPTEAEWEISCRAAQSSSFSIPDPKTAWTVESAGGKLHPVGGIAPNRWGLFDFHGNVAEWTASGRDDRGFTLDDRAPLSALDKFRIVRGGSILTPLDDSRSFSRQSKDLSLDFVAVGFRPVMTD